MKAFLMVGLMATAMFGVSLAADGPPMPKPEKEHEWLKAFVGEWESEGECDMMGQKMKMKGTESCKAIGGFWITSEMKSEFAGQPMTGVMTVGYCPIKKKYVGTWLCSGDSHLWHYVGEVDKDGKVLTLEAEGPDMTKPGKMCKYKDVTEFKADGTRTLTSFMLGEDGKWTKFMSMDCKKKK